MKSVTLNLTFDGRPFQLACAKAEVAINELGAAIEGKDALRRFYGPICSTTQDVIMSDNPYPKGTMAYESWQLDQAYKKLGNSMIEEWQRALNWFQKTRKS